MGIAKAQGAIIDALERANPGFRIITPCPC